VTAIVLILSLLSPDAVSLTYEGEPGVWMPQQQAARVAARATALEVERDRLRELVDECASSLEPVECPSCGFSWVDFLAGVGTGVGLGVVVVVVGMVAL